MSNKIYAEDTQDKNGLNMMSVCFAKYFFLNNYEIQMVQKFYNKCNKKNIGSGLFRINMQNLLEIEHLTLLDNLFSIYDYTMVDFNDFFQFVMFFSLAPMVAVFYFILHGLHNVVEQVTWEDILKLSSSLDTIGKIDQSVINLFKKYDMNKDGGLSFNQFCNFTSQTTMLWDPLFMFRDSLINHIFPDFRYRIILQRREYINDINEYLQNHNNKFPAHLPQLQKQQHGGKISCFTYLINNIKGIPSDYKYDYSVENIESISLSEFVYFMIKKYNKQCVCSKELFAMKYLNVYHQFPMILEIDQFYIRFKAALPKKNVSPIKLSIPFDINSSEFSQKSTHSILRDSKKNTSSYNNRISISSSRKYSSPAQAFVQQPMHCTSLMTLTRLHKYSLQSTPQSKKSLPPLKVSYRSANGNLRVPLPSTPFNMDNVDSIPETPFS